jgi:RNA polymerase sigma-70 factor (ECF subfamily)
MNAATRTLSDHARTDAPRNARRALHLSSDVPGAAGQPKPATAAPTFDNEPQLVAALRRGDERAYEELVRRSSGRMLSTARRILGDEEDARNVVQDSFLSAFRSIDRFAGDSQITTWLHRIVVNMSLMRLRSRRRHPETPIEELLPHFDGEDGHRRPSELADLAARDAGSELDRNALRRHVRDCISELPESYRTILVLRDLEEQSTEEVAESLGLTEGNVKTRLHRARQALKTLLEKRGVV